MQELKLKIRGVYTEPNHMSEVPEGALSNAENTVLDRDSLLETRRGFKKYGDQVQGGDAGPVRRLIPYQDAVLVQVGDLLKRDEGGGVWTAYTGDFSEPDTGYRVRDAESDDNLYLTTAAGVQKLDVVDGDFRAAGTPQPLDAVSTLTGSSGFLPDDTNVAYRATLHYTDANEKEIVSAPSQRVVVPNAAGGARDVSLQWYIPTGLTTEYSMRVYRSAETAALLDEPSDDLQLVQQQVLTSGNISSGYVTIADSTPSSLRGAFIYTSPTQEGIAEQNDQPPFALDLCLYKGIMLYANVRSKHRLAETLLGAGPGSLTWVADNVATTNASAIVTSVADTTVLHVGMKVKAAAGIPSTARILSIDTATQITMNVNATATGARNVEFQDIVTVNGTEYFAASATVLVDHEFEAEIASTPATNIELTALSLVFAVNQDPTNTEIYAYYTSGFEDIPGSFEFVERGIGGDAFTASSTSGDSFSPPISTARSSSNSAAENTVMAAKFQQPEAVPLKNKFPTGSAPIKRILALRDSAVALSDKVYRLSGDSVSTLSVEVLDTTVKIVGPETAVVFNDSIFCNSDQGIVKISSNGVAVVSRAIEDDLQRVTSDLFPDFEDIAFAVAYETARRYVIFLPDEENDELPTKAMIYNAFTNAWTGPWRMTRSCGFVNPADDKMYLGADDAYVFQERKSFSRVDYADEQFDVEITDSDGTTVSLTDTSDIVEGYLLVQDFREALVLEVVDGTTVTVDTEIDWMVDDAIVYQSIPFDIEWVPMTAGNPAVMKHWQEAQFIFRDADFAEISADFSTNFIPQDSSVTLVPRDLQGAWGAAPFGDIGWGVPQRGEQILRTYIPRDARRAHWLRVGLSGSAVFDNFKLAGVSVFFEPMSQRFRTV